MRSRLSTATASIRLIAASLAVAAAIFGGLAVQMAHGHDPALGAGSPTSSSTPSSSGTSSSSVRSQDEAFGSASGGFQDQSGGAAGGVVTRAS